MSGPKQRERATAKHSAIQHSATSNFQQIPSVHDPPNPLAAAQVYDATLGLEYGERAPIA